MPDINRIPHILAALEAAWVAHADNSLVEVLAAAAHLGQRSVASVSDDQWPELLYAIARRLVI